MKKQNTGFSIVELAITLALAAIVVTMAAPTMSTLTKGSRITAATNEFVTSLQYARTQALTVKQSISVIPVDSADWAKGWNVVEEANDKVLRTFPAVGGTVTMLSTGKVDKFTFNLAGFLTTATDSLHVCDSSQTDEQGRELTITAVGRVKTDSNYQCD